MRITTAIAAVLILLTACQSDPDPTGIGLLPDGDLIRALRFDSQLDSSDQRSSTYLYPSPHASTSMLSVGEADGYRSVALLRWLYFNVDSSLAYGGRIVSATLRLRALPYHIGDPSSSFRLEAREITSFYNVFTITADSLTKLQRSIDPVGVFEGSFGPTDSIDLAVDSTLIRKWMQNSLEQKYTENYGILLEAPGGGSIRSFQSLDAANSGPPRLTIVIETADGLDTLRGESADNTSLVTGPKREEAGRIILQSGVSVRGTLYFDMSAIPAASIVNHAVLYLTKDEALRTRYFRSADSVLVYESVDSSDNILSSSGIITRIDNAMPGVLIAEGAPLTRAVQNWVNRKGNRGLILLPMYEISDIDRMALYGANAEPETGPGLVVTYTTQP